jgi:hypothetical protein
MKKILIITVMSLCLHTKYIYAHTNDCLCSVGADAVDGTQRKITLNQARALVWAALTPDALRLKKIEIMDADENPENISSYEDSDRPRFLIFSVIWDRPPDGVFYYAVDIYTGDVFNPVASCPEYNNKKLEMLQKKIRHSLHLTQVKYQKLKTNGPECVE